MNREIKRVGVNETWGVVVRGGANGGEKGDSVGCHDYRWSIMAARRLAMPIHDWNRVKPSIFHDFHAEWLVQIKHALNGGVLPRDYYALAEQIAGDRTPDVLTLQRPIGDILQGRTRRKPKARSGSTVADCRHPRLASIPSNYRSGGPSTKRTRLRFATSPITESWQSSKSFRPATRATMRH